MTNARSGLLAFATWLALAGVAAASDETIERVKDLYLSAEYEQALSLLDQRTADPDPALAGSLEVKEYRVYCLIALGRNLEARDAIGSMLNADPFYQLPQVSPRVRTIFEEVRQSQLPSIAQRAYADAKAAFERQDPQSTSLFERVLALLNDSALATVPTMADLRTVATAFRDLSRAMAERREAAAASEPPTPVATTGVSQPAPVSVSPILYGEGDEDVVPPETENQLVPRWFLPRGLSNILEARLWQGLLEVVIDERGDVLSARLLQPFHPAYDARLLEAARSWKYKPARRNGTPVRFLKLIAIRFSPTN